MIENLTYTTIGKASHLKGTFHFVGPTYLLGKMNGEIFMSEHSKLVIEIGAEIDGKIEGGDVEIYGQCSGEIKATGKVILYPTATVQGTIKARHLEILPGAVVNMNGHTEE